MEHSRPEPGMYLATVMDVRVMTMKFGPVATFYFKTDTEI